MPRSHNKGLRFFKRMLIAGIFVIILAGIAFLIYAAVQWGTFDRSKLESYDLTTFVYDKQGDLIDFVHGQENRIYIELHTLPDYVKNSFLAAEDLRFYKHFGVDVIRVFGAVLNNLRTGSYSQGASTITQQLVKLTHLTPEKKIERKLKEMYYALQVERQYSKDEILEMYINYVYFGAGCYGIEAAAQRYFGVAAKDLTIAQAASLAAILKSPSAYAPHLYPDANKKRRDLVLETMLEEGMISPEQAVSAKDTPVEILGSKSDTKFGWFVDEAVSQAAKILDIEYQQLASGGYHIYTTLDPSAQNICEKVVADGATMPQNAANGEPAQCAIALMEKDGAVLALVGGRNYATKLGLNRATDAYRQPGSVLKPLAVYAPAFELLGVQTVTYLQDTPMDFDGYTPRNYGDIYYQAASLRTAFEKSLNVPAVTLLNQMGVDAARQYLSRFSIPLDPNDRYLPLALGSMTQGVRVFDLCSAYLAFINDGMQPEAYLISSILDHQNQTRYEHTAQTQTAISASTACLIADMMRTTATQGTGRRLSALGYPIGAKTGTVDYEGLGNRDAWAAAITPRHAIVVWMGFDSTSVETYLDSSVTGGNHPTRTIYEILRQYLPEGDGEFSQPSDVVRLSIDAKTLWDTGKAVLATDITPAQYTLSEVFSVSNRPYEASTYWQIPPPPIDFRITSGPSGRPEITFANSGEPIRYRIYRKCGEEVVEIATINGQENGALITFIDQSAHWLTKYEYYITAEHALAVDSGVAAAVSEPTQAIQYQVPFLSSPFERWNWDINLDF